MKIGILGGTFDPIHNGHLILARAAQKQFHLGKVFFIPAFIPPHKSTRRDLTPAPYRYRMVELAIRREKDFEILDVELNRPDVSYTVDTLHALQKKYPKDEFYLILGADSLAEMPDWRDPEEIKKMAKLLAAPRKFSKIEPQAKRNLQGVEWIQMSECPISSSAIRQKIREGKSLEKDLLPEGVGEYIQKMNLYSGHESCR